jgi:hypothetical protein
VNDNQDNVVDLSAIRGSKAPADLNIEGSAEAEVETDPYSEGMMECSFCQNKAFALFHVDVATKDSSIPGYDLVCTACNTIVDFEND